MRLVRVVKLKYILGFAHSMTYVPAGLKEKFEKFSIVKESTNFFVQKIGRLMPKGSRQKKRFSKSFFIITIQLIY